MYAELAFDYHTGVATEEPVELQRHVEEDKELKRPKKSFVQDLEVIYSSHEMSAAGLSTQLHVYAGR